ncbi:MAG: T9SS type A sorting domain-containing protein, partial [Leadbetterella sp.]|nr:T9SS type A sorting domain-containing protein [Leadbetterella sp.]
SDGTLWAWGDNFNGQLGNGTYTEQYVPIQIGSASTWQQVAAGPFHTVAIKSIGELWAWGDNNYGQLGNGISGFDYTPIEISCPTSSTNSVLFPISHLQIMPNPAQNEISISLDDIITQDLIYEVRNILGAITISRQSLTNNQWIDVSALAQGVYIITVSNKKGQISKQFVKM